MYDLSPQTPYPKELMPLRRLSSFRRYPLISSPLLLSIFLLPLVDHHFPYHTRRSCFNLLAIGFRHPLTRYPFLYTFHGEAMILFTATSTFVVLLISTGAFTTYSPCGFRHPLMLSYFFALHFSFFVHHRVSWCRCFFHRCSSLDNCILLLTLFHMRVSFCSVVVMKMVSSPCLDDVGFLFLISFLKTKN